VCDLRVDSKLVQLEVREFDLMQLTFCLTFQLDYLTLERSGLKLGYWNSQNYYQMKQPMTKVLMMGRNKE
jgi:hypothetical protein